MDLECALVQAFGWSLWEIDETDVDTLIPFLRRFVPWKTEQATGGKLKFKYIDEVDWF